MGAEVEASEAVATNPFGTYSRFRCHTKRGWNATGPFFYHRKISKFTLEMLREKTRHVSDGYARRRAQIMATHEDNVNVDSANQPGRDAPPRS